MNWPTIASGMNWPTIAELSADLAAGRTTPGRLVERVLERLEEVGDPAIVISAFSREVLRARAAEVAATEPSSPLWGIPFMVKDNIDVAGLDTTAGCPEFAYRPARSAAVVERLEAAGAIVVAKTNLDQFATGLVGTRSPYGTPRNVVDPDRVPGGSSSGSGVAVAAGIVPFALGTDTAGSGRVPAALNGVVGAKPTRGWLSTSGVVPAVRTLDCVSVFATTVPDAWMVLEAAAGFDAEDPFSRRPVGWPAASGELRVGIGVALPEDVRIALDKIGAVVDVDLRAYLDAGALLYGSAFVAERFAAVGDFVTDHPDAVDPVVGAIIGAGSTWSAADLARAQYELAAHRRVVDGLWDSVDVLVLPTVDSHPTLADVVADPVGVNAALGRFTSGTNLCDLCAVTIPGTSGEPGVSVLGPAWSDTRVAAAAAALDGLLSGGSVSGGHDPWVPASNKGVLLAVVGAHLRGQPLHGQLVGLGAQLVEATTTAEEYRLFALPDTEPAKPGLVRVGVEGAAIAVEVYRLSPEAFGTFVAAVPAPLCIGSVNLAGGRRVSGFLCEPAALDGAADITRFGGWRAYLSPS